MEKMDRSNLFSLANTWILCAIFLVFASVYGFSFERGSFNTFVGAGMSGGAGESGISTLIKAQNIAAYLLSLVCILPFIKGVWTQLRQNAVIFSVLGWAILSVLWSDLPMTSAVNVFRLTIDLALVLYLFERYSANDIQKLMLLVGYVAAFGTVVMVLVFPQYGLQSRGLYALGAWEGIFGHKNICGQTIMLLLLPAFFVKLDGTYARILRGGYIATALVIIVMTRSAAAWIFSVCCLTFVVLLKLIMRMPRKDVAAVMVAIAGTGVAAGAAITANFSSLMYALGKDPTLTGRTMIWSALLRSLLKHPLNGYGLMAFWQSELKGESANFTLQMHLPGYGSADSAIIELGLELGLIGLLLYGAIFFVAVKDAAYCIARGATPAVLWYASILVYTMTSNIEGGALLRPSDLACILPFVAYVGLRREARRLRQSEPLILQTRFPLGIRMADTRAFAQGENA
jgi:exopolysaccharide production protein ExoQ